MDAFFAGLKKQSSGVVINCTINDVHLDHAKTIRDESLIERDLAPNLYLWTGRAHVLCFELKEG